MRSLAKHIIVWCAATAMLLPGVVAHADEEAALPPETAAQAEDRKRFQSADSFDIDLFAPVAPALISLGVSPRNVSDPGAIQDFDYDIASVGGNLSSGIGAAISINPYWVGAQPITLNEYQQQSWPKRVWARTQLSFGAARAGTENLDAIVIGVGVQTQLLDAQDHRFDKESYACIDRIWNQYRRADRERQLQDAIGDNYDDLATAEDGDTVEIDIPGFDTPQTAAEDANLETFLAHRRSCRDGAISRLLANPSWKFGGGTGIRSEEGSLGNFDYNGGSLWTSYRQPIDDRGRFAVFGFLRGDKDVVVDMENDLQAEADAYLAGIGLAHQRTWLRIDASVSFNHREFEDFIASNDDFLTYAGTVDVRLREGIWVGLGGGAFSGSRFTDGGFYSARLRVAYENFSPF